MPPAGSRLVKGTLQSRGFRVQWERVRASMHRVDTVGILFRMNQLGCIVRRTRSVPGPKSLMHIDTSHKLTRVYNYICNTIFTKIVGHIFILMFNNCSTQICVLL